MVPCRGPHPIKDAAILLQTSEHPWQRGKWRSNREESGHKEYYQFLVLTP